MQNKLLFITNVDWSFLSHRLPIALAAIEQGYEVHIATPLTDKADILRTNGLIVHSLHLNRKSLNPLSNLLTLLHLVTIIKKIKPTLVHAITIKPVLLSGIAARITKAPALVVAVPGLGFMYTNQNIKTNILRKFINIAYQRVFAHPNIHVIFQNEDDRRLLIQLTQLPIAKTTLIRGSGVNLNDYSIKPLPTEKPTIIMAARLLAEKGIHEFVKAAQIISQSGYDAHFVLVGKCDPGNPSSLQLTDIENWVKQGYIHYWGYRTDMPNVLSSGYAVVLPSYYGEGLPKVLIEAAACARAVITTNVPGCRDAIEPGVTGLLIPARDPQALATAIKQLLDDPIGCQRMGNAGRQLAERTFDIKSVINKHLIIYQKLEP